MNPDYLKNEMDRIGQKKLLDAYFVAEEIYKLIDSNLDSGNVVVIDE